MGPLKVLILAGACLAVPAYACDAPDDGINTPWRRAVSKVRWLQETDAWIQAQASKGVVVEYVVLLDSPRHLEGKCWWPVEVRAEGKTWKRFLVTPDGKLMREERGG